MSLILIYSSSTLLAHHALLQHVLSSNSNNLTIITTKLISASFVKTNSKVITERKSTTKFSWSISSSPIFFSPIYFLSLSSSIAPPALASVSIALDLQP